MFRYLIVESNENIKSYKDALLDILSSAIHVENVNEEEKRLIIFYQSADNVSLEEIFLNFSADTLINYRVYESYFFTQTAKLSNHIQFITSKLKLIPFNKFLYINDLILLQYLLEEINKNEYHYFLKRYDGDLAMRKTLRVYFESNQNMSKAAQQLYIHRNTLIQRIDKFVTETGFDVRKFIPAYLIYYLLTH